MGWAIGFDDKWQRDIGYGVPAWCDYPGCYERIDRGLTSVCCGQEPYGGDDGCGLYFCEEHHGYMGGGERAFGLCERCYLGQRPFQPSQDLDEWILFKLTDESWAGWRAENPWFAEVNGALIGDPALTASLTEMDADG